MIGTGGKVIREIVEQTGARSTSRTTARSRSPPPSSEQAQAAIDWIRGIVAEPEIGVIYNGKVVKTADFGAFVNFLGSRDGLVHISELQQGRVDKTTDVVNVGDAVKVKVHRLRRARQGEAVDAGGRSGDRRGHHRQGRCQAGGAATRRAGGDRESRPRSVAPAGAVAHIALAATCHRMRTQLASAGGTSRRGAYRWTARRERTMKAINAIRMGGVDVLPLVEGGKGVAISNGIVLRPLGGGRRRRHVQRRQRRQLRRRRPAHPADLSRPHPARAARGAGRLRHPRRARPRRGAPTSSPAARAASTPTSCGRWAAPSASSPRCWTGARA